MQKNKEYIGVKNKVAELFEAIFELKEVLQNR